MSVKPAIHEICPRCGGRRAYLDGKGGVIINHDCPNKPPGPHLPPRRLRLSEVIWESAPKASP